MAQGQNASRNGYCGREYWSRRPYSMIGVGKDLKILTHRKERRIYDRELAAELAIADNDA